MNCLIALALLVAGAHATSLYRPPYKTHHHGSETFFSKKLVYNGRFVGTCRAYNDGYFYRDQISFVQCDNGRAILQNCAPGTYNAEENTYKVGDSEPSFCSEKDESYPTNAPAVQEPAPTHGPNEQAPTHGPVAEVKAPTHAPKPVEEDYVKEEEVEAEEKDKSYEPIKPVYQARRYSEDGYYRPYKVEHNGPVNAYDRAFDYGRGFYEGYRYPVPGYGYGYGYRYGYGY